MNDREKDAAKRYRRRMWLLIALDTLLLFGALALTAFGRRNDNNILMFVGMLVLAASCGGVALAMRGLNRQLESEMEALAAEASSGEDEADEEDAFLLTPDAAPPDLIVMAYPSDMTYQVLPGEQELHFVQLSWGDWMSVKALDRMLEPGGTDADIRAGMEKGFSVPWREIEKLDVTFKRCVSTQKENFGIFTLESGGKRRRFILLSRDEEIDTPARVRSFFAPAARVYSADTQRYDVEQDALRADREEQSLRGEPGDPERIRKLQPLRWALAGAVVLAGLVWRFLDVPYAPFAALVVGLTLLPMALVAVWPKLFSAAMMMELQRNERSVAPDTVDLSYAILVGGLLLMIGGFADFNVVNWGWLIAVSAVFAAIMTMLMTRTLPSRKLWVRRLAMLLMLTMFSIGAVLELNYLLDFREPAAEEAVITDKSVSGGRSTSYDLCFDGDRSYSVTKEDFDALAVGDTVVLVEYRGGLGVRYVDVWPCADWYGA